MEVRDSYQSENSDSVSFYRSGVTDKISFDEALEKVGASNWYQKRAFLVFGLQWLFANWILFAPMYIFTTPDAICGDDQECQQQCPHSDSFANLQSCQNFICALVKYIQYSANIQTKEQQLNHLSDNSLLMAFNNPLICDRQSIGDVLKSMTYAGSLLGFFIFSFIADNYGRRPGLGISWFAATIGAVVLASSGSFEMVGVGIFMLGFGVNPAITIQYSLFNEHTCIFIVIKSKKVGHFRDIQNIGVQIFFGVGEMLIVFIAYYFPYWRIMAIYWFSIPLIVMNFGILLVYESPKFLFSKSRLKAVKILNRIAKVNKRSPIEVDQLEPCKNSSENNQRVYSLIDLLKYRSLNGVFFCGFVLFFSIQVAYYGLNFAMENIGLGLYKNAFIIGACETAAFSVADHIIVKLPRRKTIMIGMCLTCALSMTFFVLKPPEDCGDICSIKIIQLCLAGLLRFIICFVQATAYVYLAELFPTVVRSLALGIISAGGTVGSVLSPFVKTISDNMGVPNPIITYGALALFGALAVSRLRETLNKPLLDEIEEDSILQEEKIEEIQ